MKKGVEISLGGNDRLFRGRLLSVVYRRFPVGLVGVARFPCIKFSLTFEPAAGLFRHRTLSSEWRALSISGRRVICTPQDVEHDSRWEREVEAIEIYLEERFLTDVARSNLPALLSRDAWPEADTDAALWELAGAIRFLCSEPKPDAALILDDGALIARRILTNHAFPSAADTIQKLSDELRQKMDGFIRAHLSEHFRAPTLSRAVGLSQQHLTTLCRNTTGNSPMEYVWRCRLVHAQELARTGKYTRSEIVHICGFSDLSHLNRRFKAFFKYPLSVLIKSANRSKVL